MSDYDEQKAAFENDISHITTALEATDNASRKLILENQLRDTEIQLEKLKDHHSAMTAPIDLVLKNNGLDAGTPNDPAHVNERLKQEMFKCANNGDIAGYKRYRAQRKELNARTGPGGVLIGKGAPSITIRKSKGKVFEG